MDITNELRRICTLIAVGLALTASAPVQPAEAAIRCNKGYQLVGGNEIATPYCQDEYLAVVARKYGVSTSGARIRNNPNHKREVCRLVGQDIRVQQTCVDSLPTGRGFRF